MCDLNEKLYRAVNDGNVEQVQKLLTRGSSVDYRNSYNDETPLHVARNKEIAEILIKYGANVNSTDSGGWTPLHIAIAYGNIGLTQILIVNKADVHAVTSEKWTPLHLSAYNGNTQVTNVLLKAYADVRAINEEARGYSSA
ncbi:notch-regulated ankyrin repeat-containing protein A-like [Mytilus galloprovincialis]|uniref:notch-regulated ankyrin repeat-containing protein A-like n=1 Tax=Mytilus galloprovincialis TaxID=29158 RepID=UPI003F7C32C9